jgi:hypothetical protein
MAHPLATKAISSARVKNDRVDAKTLAHLLRTDLLPEAWAAPPEVRDARKLGRTHRRCSSESKCQRCTGWDAVVRRSSWLRVHAGATPNDLCPEARKHLSLDPSVCRSNYHP